MGLCYLIVCLKHVNDPCWVSRSFAPSHRALIIIIIFLRAVFRAEPQLTEHLPGRG